MLIIMQAKATKEEISSVTKLIEAKGLTALSVPGPTRTAICITGNKDAELSTYFSTLDGVKEVIRVTKPYKLVSRETHEENTIIDLDGVKIGGNHPPVFMAGPCSVENIDSTINIAKSVKEAGVSIFRAGAYKPRTNPYSFQGLEEKGLEILNAVKQKTGLKIVTEVINAETLSAVTEIADIIQVGTRNMYNYSLLKKLGTIHKPILLKRGFSATVEEWLNAAEYIMMGGNRQVILCERGIRTFSQHSRNTLDLNVIPLLKEITHLPILADPSHGVGKRNRVRPMARAAVACGADGLIIETHTHPDEAYSDGAQTISIETLKALHNDVEILNQLPQLS